MDDINQHEMDDIKWKWNGWYKNEHKTGHVNEHKINDIKLTEIYYIKWTWKG